MATLYIFRYFAATTIAAVLSYLVFLVALTFPVVQNQVVYLNLIKLTWFKDVNIPEQWGFLQNQVTSFSMGTPDGELLHAWHILPLEVYRRNEEELLGQSSGYTADVTSRLSFKLLRDDPEALLVVYLHGAAGTLGSGWRPPSYRGISSGAPDKIHIVAIDYRGFGSSTGVPSEQGLLIDAKTVVDWALNTANISPSKIVIFGQSLGTAVSLSLVDHMAAQEPPIFFSGVVLVAPFADVASLSATYRIAGTIPLLSPVAYFPSLLKFLNGFIKAKWPSNIRLGDYLRRYEYCGVNCPNYYVNIIHAEDDYDIPFSHSDLLYWSALKALAGEDISLEEYETAKESAKKITGAGGWMTENKTDKGVIRLDMMKYGLHDRIMSYSIVSLAVLRAFQNSQQ